MIFYFSATGNCKHVATQISSAIDEELISIADCIKNQQYKFPIKKHEKIGIISPTYFLGLPTVVLDFLQRVEWICEDSYDPYIYHVATYGTTIGQSGGMVRDEIQKKGLSLNARFCVKMPDTWTPIYDLSSKEKVDKMNRAADKEIPPVADKIKAEAQGDFSRNKAPMFAVNLYYPKYRKMRLTKNFSIDDSCIGCNLCAKRCPVGAIELRDKKPVWIEEECTLCLGCLHHCPKFAIQYGPKTRKHGQYKNPNVKV